jgi:hypothetical protein
MSNGMSKDLCCIVRIVDTRWELSQARFFFASRLHVGNTAGESRFAFVGSNTVETVRGVFGSCTIEVTSCIQ